ncbi:hypothetical protein CHS0354_032734 [Potamilus streckersoni]|uniref:DNA annealing helicase and endonuclease ZRANB3 n=1 Tax=Potamilus streckersoni TaxID=2493646 RepID=A0AAE0TJE7_9BIVA|nr:hypothetical protein CHS0354_032734 [Potamilus streckersoni]
MMTCEESVFGRLPAKLVKTLMPFQREGIINAVQKNGRCLIADEMGLGKTIQAISVAYYYRNEWPLLIIVPSSLRYSWVEELEKWLPDVGPNDVNVIQYGSDVSGIPSAHITVAAYGLLSKSSSNLVREALINQNFQVVIVDESHYIRNQKTASCKAVVPLIKNANRRLLLSGTPALARPVELFPQVDAICPGEFGSWWSFTSRYCGAKIEWIGRIKRRRVDGASNLEELQAMLTKKLMIRRAKDEVLTQLPPKQRQKVLFDLKESEIKKEIRKLFEELKPLLKMKDTSMAEILTGGGEDSPANNGTLGLIQRLYKLSGEAKIGPAKEYVEMLCENQSLKFLVFAYHHAMMNGLQQSLRDKMVKFIRIDGETKPSERLHLVQQFQSDPEIRVAILSILAAGVGLTLTAAKLVMFAEMYWTPGVMIQCEDRAHRIGQTSSIPVHYLVAKDTMDEWVWSAVCKKTIVTTMTLNGQKQVLQACGADKSQVDILSNADAWIPDQNDKELDLLNYFQSQQSNGQKSILDYFSSQSSQGSSKINSWKRESPKKKLKDSALDLLWKDDIPCVNIDNKHVTENENIGLDSPGLKKPISENKLKAKSRTQRVIVIDISDDDEEFASKEKSSKRPKKLDLHLSVSNQKTSEVENGSKRTCKLNLAEKFSCQNDPNDNESDFDLGFEFSLSPEDFGNMDLGKITKVQPNSCNVNIVETKDISWSTSTPFTKENNLLPLLSNTQNAGSSLNKSESKKSEYNGQPGESSSSDSLSYLKKKLGSNNQSNLESPVGLKKEKERSSQSGEFTELSNPSTIKDVVTSSAHWGCSVCTYLNHCELPYCEMCETPKKEQILPQPATRSCVKRATGLQFGFTKNDRTDQKNMKRDSVVLLHHSSGKNSKHLAVELEDKSAFEDREDTGFEERVVTDVSVDNNESSFQQINSIRSSVNTISSPFSCNFERSQAFQGDKNDPVKMTPFKPTSCQVIMHNIGMNSCNKNLKVCGNKGNVIVTDDSIETKVKKRGEKRKRSSFDKEDSWKDMLDITEYDSRDEMNVSKTDITHSGEGDLLTENEMQTGLHDLHPATDDSQAVTKSTDCVTVNSESTRVVDFNKLPVYSMFQFICSKYTGRVYLYDQDGTPLHINFLPMDIEVGNHDDLPDLLLHPNNIQLVQRFVREWNSLTETKRRLIIKSGQLFVSPLRAYEDIKSCKTVCTQRNKTKLDTAVLAAKKAAETGGSVRVISRNSSQDSGDGQEKGVAQAVNSDGTPLCIHCQKPYKNKCLTDETIVSEKNAWKTRFCSYQCAQDYWIQTSASYCRDKVLEAEHGICQLCGFDAQSFYKHVRDTSNLQKRAELISQSKFSTLTGKQKEQMVRKPVEGQFWHVDHILPVFEGGGECDIDNLRTLCVICHQKITANQARKRAIVRKLGTAAKSGDITAFFQPR